MIVETILWLIFIGAIIWVVLWFIAPMIGAPKKSRLQRELDLRLTYKRYIEIYPSAKITYPEYKRMQFERAYKKAVSSTKNKRMVR